MLGIRYFMAAVAAGSLSRAAVRLGVTQPALSRQIQKLETELQSQLLYRHGRSISLTGAGERFLKTAAEVVQQLANVREELVSGSLDAAGVVTLGLPPSIAASLGADLSIRFAATFPRARLRIREAFSSVLLEWAEAGRLDLAVLYDARRSHKLIATPLLLEDLFLIEPPGEAVGEAAELAELTRLNCVLPGPENGLRRVLDAACAAEGVTPRVLTEVDCVAALKQLVERGAGVTVLPFGAVHREVGDGRLRARPFRSPAMRAMLVIATSSHRPFTPLARNVVRMTQAEVQRLVPLDVLRGVAHGLNGWERPHLKAGTAEPVRKPP